MDLTTDYRTKYPPKEHEEAVRMLLEEINNSKANSGAQQRAPKPQNEPARWQAPEIEGNDASNSKLESKIKSTSNSNNNISTKPTIKNQAITNDSFSSNESGLVELDAGIGSVTNTTNSNSTQAKSTSVSGSTSNSLQSPDSLSQASSQPSSVHREHGGDPIPSRTIAIQCDLKSSSLRRNEPAGSMQASSISSTRFGFYSYSRETLERRRRQMQSESVMQKYASNAHLKPNISNQVEAPTSMSELSSSSSVGNFNDLLGSSQKLPKPKRANRGPNLYSSNEDLEQSLARIRVNSLARRPRTALSFVSNSKLRNQTQDGSGNESNDDDYRFEQLKGVKRAKSQLDLPRSRTPTTEPAANQDSSSDCCIDPEELEKPGMRTQMKPRTTSSRFQANLAMYQQSNNLKPKSAAHQPLGNPKPVDPLSATLGGNRHKLSRPSLLSSLHNEHVRDYKTLGSPLTNRSSQANINQQEVEFIKQTDAADQMTENVTRFTSYRKSDPHAGLLIDAPTSRIRSTREPVDGGYDCKFDECKNCHDDPDYSADDEMRKLRYSDAYSNNLQYHMSLSRPPRRSTNLIHQQRMNQQHQSLAANGKDSSNLGQYPKSFTVSRQPRNLSRNDRTFSSQTLASSRPSNVTSQQARTNGNLASTIGRRQTMNYKTGSTPGYDVHRSTSMRHTEASALNKRNQYLYPDHDVEYSDDSESPSTKTWANPISSKHQDQSRLTNAVGRRLRALRSSSVRDVNRGVDDEHIGLANTDMRYAPNYVDNKLLYDDSSSDVSSQSMSSHNQQQHLLNSYYAQQLNHDSQYRLNESGLPEVSTHDDDILDDASRRFSRDTAPFPESYAQNPNSRQRHHQYQPRTLADTKFDRSAGGQFMVSGRAWSQQSLTRPTMPLRNVGRRQGGSNSGGSDVGGSSMSLVSRLNGRFESARTRSPVVMYIPKSSSRSDLVDPPGSVSISKSNTLKKRSTLSRSKASRSHTGSKRSLASKNESDSESSMLRTLIKPRQSRAQDNYANKRLATGSRQRNNDDDEENVDNLGQLASEMDSYKFSRRYSVPKDAKINWFSKLRQRVSMAASK